MHRKNVSIVHNNVCSLLPKIDTINISNELSDISVPFHINYILYGSSEFSYNLNCKIVSYVHSYIIASKRF